MYLEQDILAYTEVTSKTSYSLCYCGGKTTSTTCTEEYLEKMLSDLRKQNYIEVKNGESIYFVDRFFKKAYGWPNTLIVNNAKKNLSKTFSRDVEEWSKNLAELMCGLCYSVEENIYIRAFQKDIKIGIEACIEKFKIDVQQG